MVFKTAFGERWVDHVSPRPTHFTQKLKSKLLNMTWRCTILFPYLHFLLFRLMSALL